MGMETGEREKADVDQNSGWDGVRTGRTQVLVHILLERFGDEPGLIEIARRLSVGLGLAAVMHAALTASSRTERSGMMDPFKYRDAFTQQVWKEAQLAEREKMLGIFLQGLFPDDGDIDDAEDALALAARLVAWSDPVEAVCALVEGITITRLMNDLMADRCPDVRGS
jgi:hypothetical protein